MGKSPKIPTVSLERLPDGICMSPIRPSVCSQDIYKTNETSSCTSSQIWHTLNLIIYLDDILFMNQTPTGLQRDMSTAIHLLENLGFVINLTKSQLKPTQSLEFLGFIVDTKNMTPVLPQGKVTIKDLCSQMLSQTELTVRDIARLIGKLTASIQAIFPAPLHYRQLQSLKNTALQSGGNYNTKVSLNPACQE